MAKSMPMLTLSPAASMFISSFMFIRRESTSEARLFMSLKRFSGVAFVPHAVNDITAIAAAIAAAVHFFLCVFIFFSSFYPLQ